MPKPLQRLWRGARMPSPLKRLWRGARRSEYYGSHPGTPPLLFLIAAGAIAGGDRDPIRGPLLGTAVMAILYGPLWLIGCWHRGDASAQDTGRRPPQDS